MSRGLLALLAFGAIAARPPDPERARLVEAARWIHAPRVERARYEYSMTGKIRLLVFWVGRDDVGGGYIRYSRSAEQPAAEAIEVLFGSDPDKAPRRINRWGAATEALRIGPGGRPEEGVFWGFMKASKGASVAEMEKEIADEKAGGRHRFEANLSRADRASASSMVVPFSSDVDFDFRQLERAEAMVLDRLRREAGRVRRIDGAEKGRCENVAGFLFTVRALVDDALAGVRTPRSRCYVYNARLYTATLRRVEPVARRTIRIERHGGAGAVETAYTDLLSAELAVTNHDTGKTTRFKLLVGRSGALRGVPVQITYQPNWWVRLELKLLPGEGGPRGTTSGAAVP